MYCEIYVFRGKGGEKQNKKKQKNHPLKGYQSIHLHTQTYYDVHMRAWPHPFEGDARDAVYAGAGAINDGDGDIRLQLVNPLQHWPLGPATWRSHILKSSFPTGTRQGKDNQ